MNNNEENLENKTEDGFKIIDSTETAEVEVDHKQNKPFLKEVLSYIILIVVAFVVAQVTHRYLFTPVTVDGASMNPNLQNKDVVFLSRLGTFERFDVVVFEAPDTDYYIKRLIGLPGDYVQMSDDQLYINGENYEEPYLDFGKSNFSFSNTFTPDFTLEEKCFEKISLYTEKTLECNINGKIQVPEGYYLVLGDNRPFSNDSTELGLINADRFIGEAKFVLYPFKRFGKINND
jgi:signal peptidase I